MTPSATRIASAVVVAVFATTACSTAPSELVVSGETAPPAAPETPRPSDVIPGDDPSSAPGLLTSAYLPGWEISDREPSAGRTEANTTDCARLDSFFAVTGAPVDRVHGGNGSVTSLTNGIVSLASNAAATAFMDDLDAVWEPCVVLTTLDGGRRWLEPLELPSVEGWRAAGLAFGSQENLVLHGFWQQDSTVVHVELDGGFDLYQHSEPVFAAMAAILAGDPPAPTDAPGPANALPVDEAAEPVPTPAPTTATELPVRRSDDDEWRDHPLAPLVVDPSDLGESWELDYVDIIGAAGAGAEASGSLCGVDEPPFVDGLGPTLVSTAGAEAELEQLLMSGSVAVAHEWLDVLRALPGCPVEELGLPAEFALVDRPIRESDDSVCLQTVTTEPSEDDLAIGIFCMAAYDDLLIGIFWAAAEGALDLPSVDRAAELIETVATRR